MLSANVDDFINVKRNAINSALSGRERVHNTTRNNDLFLLFTRQEISWPMTPKLNNPDFIFSYYERRIILHVILLRSWSTSTIVSERQFRDNTSDFFFQNSLLILYNFSSNVLDIQFLTHTLENSSYNIVALSNIGRAINMKSTKHTGNL